MHELEDETIFEWIKRKNQFEKVGNFWRMKICLAHNYIFFPSEKKTFSNLMNGETWTEILNSFFYGKMLCFVCRFMIAILFENIR